MDYTELVKAIATVIFVVISMFVVPWIKKNTSAAKLAKILKYVEIFVAAADQLFEACDGKEKKAYVLQRLEEMNFKIDSETLDAFIEAEVLKLHNKLKEYADPSLEN